MVLMLFATALLATSGGCMTKAEQEFIAADCRGISLYVQIAKPAVESYADVLEASGRVQEANQLRADTRALDSEIMLNVAARMDKLDLESQAVTAARNAVKAARALLDIYERYRTQRSGAPPADETVADVMEVDHEDSEVVHDDNA
jgi:hypothetical protein